jgi:ATP-binding cassette subfamily F protein 3
LPATKEERLKSREEEKQRQKEERARQKKIAEVEGTIEKAEAELHQVEEKLADPAIAGDYALLQQLGTEHAAIEARLAGLYGEWEGLQEG